MVKFDVLNDGVLLTLVVNYLPIKLIFEEEMFNLINSFITD